MNFENSTFHHKEVEKSDSFGLRRFLLIAMSLSTILAPMLFLRSEKTSRSSQSSSRRREIILIPACEALQVVITLFLSLVNYVCGKCH